MGNFIFCAVKAPCLEAQPWPSQTSTIIYIFTAIVYFRNFKKLCTLNFKYFLKNNIDPISRFLPFNISIDVFNKTSLRWNQEP